jgi:hypothetical protein
MFWGNSSSLFQQFMELRKVYETGMKRKASYEIKSNLSLEISKYIIILFIYKTKRNYISIWIVFIKIFQKQATDVLN